MKIETEVSKEIYEAANGLAKFAVVTKRAMDDGWDMSQDLAPVMASAMADLLPSLQGIENAKEEYEEDPVAAVNAIQEGMKPLIEELVKKEEVVA